jgi:uncharacterized protein YcfJ
MKTLIAIAACMIAFSSSANAESFGRVTEVRDVYTYTNVERPENRCYDVSVPVYSNRHSDGGDVLLGMIIGGALGKAVTGNDNGAAIGAVIGGVSSADKTRQVQVGTRVERQCETIYVQQRVPVVTSYVITYRWNGNSYTTETNDYYEIGDQVRIVPQIQ